MNPDYVASPSFVAGPADACPAASGADAGCSHFYDADLFATEDNVGYLMKRVLVSITQQVDRRLVEHGLTTAQWGPLLRVKKSGSAPVAELARWLHMDAGAMTRLLDRLERKGLCRRVRCTADRRVVRVELTAEGDAAIVVVPGVLAEVLNAHLVGFSEAEWETMKSLLKRMLDAGEALR